MPASTSIEDLLNRRSDLSTFLVHLTRGSADGTSARDNLISILSARTLEARTSMGWLGTGHDRLADAAALDAMKVVCFSETPLEHVYSLYQEISGRSINLSNYGIAFSKSTARQKGANPVWYVNMTVGFDWEIASALDQLRDSAKTAPAGFAEHPAAKILPFIEQTGEWITTRKEFSWEREWRHRGNFTFSDLDVALVLCPEAEIDDFADRGPYAAVDPSWSLERIISAIATSRAQTVQRERRREAKAARKIEGGA